MLPVLLTSILSSVFFDTLRVLEHGLWFHPTSSPTLFIAYSDANWANCKDSYRANTGYTVFLGPNLITWRSKKKPTVSKSSTEAEYHAIGYTVVKTIWVRKLLYDLGVTLFTPVRP